MTTASLAQRTSHAFDTTARERGQRYQREGRVSIEENGLGFAAFLVRGSGDATYEVTLEILEGDMPVVEARCECPRFESGFPCKHLFAGLLELDGAPGGFEVPGTSRVDLALADDLELRDPEDEGSEYNVAVVGPLPRAARGPAQPPRRTQQQDALAWLATLRAVRPPRQPAGQREILYFLSGRGAGLGRPLVRLMQREPTRTGEPGRPKQLSIQASEIGGLGEQDARALAALEGCALGSISPYASSYGSYYDEGRHALHTFPIPQGLQPLVLPLVASTGRLFLEPPDAGSVAPELAPLRWDGDTPLEVGLRFTPGEGGAGWRITGELRRPASDPIPTADVTALLPGGLAVAGQRLLRLSSSAVASFVQGFRERGPIAVNDAALPAVMGRLAELPLPALDLPAGLGWTEASGSPQPRLRIDRPTARTPRTLLYGCVGFGYAGELFSPGDPRAGRAQPEERRIVRRDRAREAALLDELLELGFQTPPAYERDFADVQLARKRMPELVRTLLARGWQVEAQGVRVRSPGTPHLQVASGVDWFDLEGHVDFDGQAVPFPELLAALERGETTIALGDGSLGVLPGEWLARLAPLAELGQREGDAIRFLPRQATLVDALLAGQPEVEVDALFRRTCRRLEQVGRPRPRRAPRGFRGELRSYQQDGLGWLLHLEELGLAGCLADDMGLGKTVQVLALLEARRSRRGAGAARGDAAGDAPPSLAVVPKSLVHNWLAEAAHFTPELRVLDYTGPGRAALRERFAEFDLVVTSYGTLRHDVEKLAGERFDYVILDEAQAVKNAGAQTSKAARLLRAEHRLALSGTPVENHLGELWALFDFLNPGLLGNSARRARTLENAGEETVAGLARALRPFLLRRTKEQVLRELPAKTEQTLVCALEGKQKRLYDELRRHYRQSLLRRVEQHGMARSKIHVLEALLRLRQAACHPGLVDPKRVGEGSAKLDLLLARLDETLAEGHKALVFSQFTSLLAIVRERLGRAGIAHAYLDGRTQRRAECVRRFQEDPDCRLFLVSLKAGGHGLNLTAADYVFLLDPWWNPAVEAQAVDRTHRIGQTRPVFAYRLVAEDTIEEKILALQETKRRLADAIVSGQRGLLRQLTREDLETLLG